MGKWVGREKGGRGVNLSWGNSEPITFKSLYIAVMALS